MSGLLRNECPEWIGIVVRIRAEYTPLLHIIATNGCFTGNMTFQAGHCPKPSDLEDLFRYEVLKMLKSEGKINDAIIENILSWHHTGFNVYCGSTLWPHDQNALEKLARYVIREAFSQERMNYITTGLNIQNLSCARLVGPVDHTYSGQEREQTVRYYGYYSNKCRGMRKKADKDSAIPAGNHPELSPKKFRKSWARLIQKIYEVDPLVCPKCQGELRTIAFIEIPHIIKKILKHPGLWGTQ